MSGKQVRIVRELRGVTIEFGGEKHSGWLPEGAAWPPPTPIEIAVLDFEIVGLEDGSYIFEWLSRNTDHRGDTWHKTFEDALEYAKESFGIELEEWRSIGDDAG